MLTSINNQAEQHRVRACFPSNLDVKVSAAEAAFDVIERQIIVPEDSAYYGKPNPQYPMHTFVDMSDDKVGLGIFNDGIREYEALVDNDRTLAITLFRGFTATQSPVIDQWDVYPWMKLSQSLGVNEWRYAIMPHSGNWQAGSLYREAEKFNLSFETAQAGTSCGDLPKEIGFVEIENKDLALSTLKKCEHRNSLVIRLFHPTGNNINSYLKLDIPFKEVWLTNMNEERIEKLEYEGNVVNLSCDFKKIITIEIV